MQTEFHKGDRQHDYAIRRFLALMRLPGFTFTLRNDGIHIWLSTPGIDGELGGPRDKAEALIEMIRNVDTGRPADMPLDITEQNIERLVTAIQKAITQ